MKKKSFLQGASILALSVILAKVLGAMYRIPLTYLVGAEGMGIYQFVHPIFALLLTLSCGAMPTAVSISVSRYAVVGDHEGAKRIFLTILKLCFIIGLAGMLCLVAIAYPLSLLQAKEAFFGYLTIAPAVFIVSIISAFRGFFMGYKDMTPSSISQVTEGIVKLGVGITATYLLLPYGTKFAVCGALFGVVISELVTLLILFFIYLKRGHRFQRVKLLDYKEELKGISKLMVPLVLCGMILPLSQFLDSVLLVNLLAGAGLPRPLATANYGVFAGTVSPLVNLPVMVCITLGIAITPQMVEGKERRDVGFVMEKVSTATKVTFVLGVPFVFLFGFLSDGIIGLLYPNLSAANLRLASELLRISSLSVLGLSIFQIYSAMFQGLDKPYIPLKIMAVSVGVKLALSLVLVPTIGIVGGAISSTIAFVGGGVAIMVYFFYYAQKIEGLFKNTSLITLCGVIMGSIILIATMIFSGKVAIIVTILVALLVYFAGLLILRVFDKNELKSLPLAKFWLWLDKWLHLRGIGEK